jgi:hypothetical protein
MRTLRGVIGPGFNLMRLFIETKETLYWKKPTNDDAALCGRHF